MKKLAASILSSDFGRLSEEVKAVDLAGADWLNVHVEATAHLHRVIQRIKELGMKASAALNPATPLDHVQCVLFDLDMILVMTVNPGFGGQKLIRSRFSKVRECRELIDQSRTNVLLEVDGGIHTDTICDLAEAGADIFVSGSSIFRNSDYIENINALKTAWRPRKDG